MCTILYGCSQSGSEGSVRKEILNNPNSYCYIIK